MAYARGTYARAMCDVCGFEIAYLDLKKRWDGFKTCPQCWEPRHEQDNPNARIFADPESLRDPRPDNDDQNAAVYQYPDNQWELDNA